MNSDEMSPKEIASRVTSNIKQDIVKELLKISFRDPQTALNKEAISQVTELAKCLVMETCLRAAHLAIAESSSNQLSLDINFTHVQKCLPQLMLDFP